MDDKERWGGEGQEYDNDDALSRGISTKVDGIAQVKFELACYDLAVQDIATPHRILSLSRSYR